MSGLRKLDLGIPPGIPFVLRLLTVHVLPIPLATYALLSGASLVLEASLPPALTAGVLALSVPVTFVVRTCAGEVRKRRDARTRGAVMAPVVKGKWPGAVDIVQTLVQDAKDGYIAQIFWPTVDELGTLFNLRVFWEDQLFTIEPDHIKQILATEFNNFEKGPDFQFAMASVLGTGVFNSDGDMWRFHRSMTRPFFTRERISDFAIFARHADAAIGALAARLREPGPSGAGYAVDAQDAMARFTLDSATEFLFGRCMHSVEAGLPYPANALPFGIGGVRAGPPGGVDAESFARAFADAQFAISNRSRIGASWPIYELTRDETRESKKVVGRYIDPILQDALRAKAEAQAARAEDGVEGKEIGEDETLLDHLVRLTDDPVILKDETLNILIAGRDTTAATLTFAIYVLAQYPDVLRKLRTEILETVGPARHPSLEDVRSMKYLRAVINETLRLYPPVPYDVRASINATTFAPTTPGGKPFYVPPRTSLSYSVFMMHRRTDLWGPDAHEFDPDRFLDARLHKYLTPNPFIFLPFNAGPRICLGQQFAYNEVSFMLVRLLQTFDGISLDLAAQPADSIPPTSWRNEPGRIAQEKLFPKSHLTMYMHKGMWVRMHEVSA